jgi:hypothetical protein
MWIKVMVFERNNCLKIIQAEKLIFSSKPNPQGILSQFTENGQNKMAIVILQEQLISSVKVHR